MTYLTKPKLHHPGLPKNALGLTRRDYEGAVSTLCAGCGHDSISAAIIQAFFELAIPPHRVAKLSGIGCSSKTPTYFLGAGHGFNSVHGRMPSVVTGAALANRDLIYLGVSGDGDSASIGLGQFAHIMRRGVNMVYIVENNGVYGLTKGQFSATADKGSKAKRGAVNSDEPIDLVQLALLLGATYVARGFSGDKAQLVPLIKAAVEHKGVAFIDVVSPCVAFNNHPGSTKSYDYVRAHNESVNRLDFMPLAGTDRRRRAGGRRRERRAARRRHRAPAQAARGVRSAGQGRRARLPRGASGEGRSRHRTALCGGRSRRSAPGAEHGRDPVERACPTPSSFRAARVSPRSTPRWRSDPRGQGAPARSRPRRYNGPMSNFRRALGIAGGALLLLFIGVAIALLTVDPKQFVGPILARVKAATGRDVTVGGDIELKIGFAPRIVAHDVRVGNAPWGKAPQLLSARQVEAQVALFPLLQRRFELVRLNLVEPVIALETNRDGRGNWELGRGARGGRSTRCPNRVRVPLASAPSRSRAACSRIVTAPRAPRHG